MNPGGSRNHGITDELAGLPIHKSSPLAKAGHVHWQDLRRGCKLFDPCIKLIRFCRVLSPDLFHASL